MFLSKAVLPFGCLRRRLLRLAPLLLEGRFTLRTGIVGSDLKVVGAVTVSVSDLGSLLVGSVFTTVLQ